MMLTFASLMLLACSGNKFAGESNAGVPEAGDSKPGDSPSTGDSIQDPNSKPIDDITNTPNTVVFGKSGVYRVGDGQAQNTTCRKEVFAYELEGSQYSFLFNVEQDDTKVSFQIGRLCGIDTDNTNSIMLVESGTGKSLASANLDRKVLDDNDTPSTPFPPTLVLSKGQYAIRVVSNNKRGPGSDRDDFIIGNLMIKGDKPIFGTAVETK